MSTIILRIHSPSGRYRLELPRTCSLKYLYKHVAEQCDFGNSSFILYMEPSFRKHVRHSSSVALSSPESGVYDGQILYAKLGTETLSQPSSLDGSSSSSSHPTIPPTTASSNPVPNASLSASVSRSRETNPKQEDTSSMSQPKFKAFDQFLKDHAYNTVDLPLNQCYRPRTLIRGQPNIIPPAVTLKHQPYRHIDHIEFMNVKEMDQFVRYWRHDLDMQQQRGGWLFGYFREDNHYPCGIRAVAEAIYEPPQIFEGGSILFVDDPFLSTAKSVASSIGLELVGRIFTHLPREESLTSDEVQQIAQLQLEHQTTSHYSGYPVSPFVTVTVALDIESNGQVSTNAYMISDLGVGFQRDGILASSVDPRRMKMRTAEKNELLPDVLESGKSTSTFDPDWLIVRVNDSAPKQIHSIFSSWSFPVENRQRQQHPSDIPDHLRSSHLSTSPSLFSDFHLLLYIARLFDSQTAAAVAEKIRQNENVDSALVETFKML